MMGVTLVDSKLFENMFSSEKMKSIFSEEGLAQKWLQVEAALAEVQAELNVIPREAAEEISKKAKLEFVDIEKLGEEIKRANHPLVPIIKQLEKACDHNYGQYVHFGATTQDIMDTATILQIKDALEIVEDRLQSIIHILIKLSNEHKETIMPGRTHGQHALPITFGYKVSVWLEEIGRHLERLEEMKKRVLLGQFSGAVGTLASLPEKGLEIHQLMMERLGLKATTVPWHAARDNIAEIASFMGLVMGTIGKIANEIRTLQKTEMNELEEVFAKGQIGSSTMPHKRNPVNCQNVATISKIVRKNTSLILENMDHEHERDMARWQIEWTTIPELFVMSDAALETIENVLDNLQVNEERMKRNLDLTNGLILSESIMLKLGEKIGKQDSHHIVYEACMEAIDKNVPLKSILLENEEIKSNLTEEEIDNLLDPAKYVGLSSKIVESAVNMAKERIGK